MPHQTTPHIQTQQDVKPGRTDLEPNELEQEADRDAPLYANSFDAQTGTNRGPEFFPPSLGEPNTEQPVAAHQGELSTRTPEGESQGITLHSATEESRRQQKVVKNRPDAEAGVNQDRKAS